MQVTRVGCTGFDDSHSFDEVANFAATSDIIEVGVPFSREKQGRAVYPTFKWVQGYLKFVSKNYKDLRHALHVDGDICRDFLNGKLSTELKKMISITYEGTEKPVVGRIQINLDDKPDLEALAKLIEMLPMFRISFPYNSHTASMLTKAAELFMFDILVDSSGGKGLLPDSWPPIIFPDRFQGYAGGLTPDNIKENLNNISLIVPSDTNIGVDVETGIKGANGHTSMKKAHAFVDNVLDWNR